MPPLGNGYISHQKVWGQVTGSEGMVSGLQQREPGDIAGTALLFADHQPVRMETPAGVQVEVEHWELGGTEETTKGEGRGGEADVIVEQRDSCIRK